MVILSEKFKFIKDNIFLCPWVDSNTGRQKLIMQKINSNSGEVELEKIIDCIHTAVDSISSQQLIEIKENLHEKEDFLKKTLNIRSSEELEEFYLDPEEQFFALKSWVAGISEAGINALKFQNQIDISANLDFSIAGSLTIFVAQAVPDFIFEFIEKIKQDCMFEGKRHKPCLLANLIPLAQIFRRTVETFCGAEEIGIHIVKALIDLDPPREIFELYPSMLWIFGEVNPEYVQKFIFDLVTDLIIVNSNTQKTNKERINEKFPLLKVFIFDKELWKDSKDVQKDCIEMYNKLI